MQQFNRPTTTNSTAFDWLLLALTPQIGPVTALKLIQHFGGIAEVLNQSHNTLAQIINPTIAKLISEKASRHTAEQAISWANAGPNRHLISLDCELYPRELAEMRDPPLVLYAHGNIELLKNNKFAIVGTRNPSQQGMENATAFAKNLADNNLTIVSGMALGIDKYAHTGALNGKASTIGIIGTGIDQVYPRANQPLYNQMLSNGGLLLSEFPLTTQPLASNFPRRNRIIAGLSKGCLVVESNIDGGSMITANLALEMGREVMAIPGSINNPATRGCHKLIKNGAKLVENVHDILEELQVDLLTQQQQAVATNITNPVLIAMGFEPIEIDKICTNLNLSFADVCPQLLELELDGKIVNCGSGRYQRIFR